MQAILPLAGKGTRLRPHTHTRPKPLLRVANRPVLDYVLRQLEEIGVVVRRAPRLVRGIDYYMRTVFEVISPELGEDTVICGGGRYDRLISDLGGPEVPGTGFAIGEDRLVEVLPATFRDRVVTRRPVAVLGNRDARASHHEGGRSADVNGAHGHPISNTPEVYRLRFDGRSRKGLVKFSGFNLVAMESLDSLGAVFCRTQANSFALAPARTEV